MPARTRLGAAFVAILLAGSGCHRIIEEEEPYDWERDRVCRKGCVKWEECGTINGDTVDECVADCMNHEELEWDFCIDLIEARKDCLITLTCEQLEENIENEQPKRPLVYCQAEKDASTECRVSAP